jgi:hypothetical protein
MKPAALSLLIGLIIAGCVEKEPPPGPDWPFPPDKDMIYYQAEADSGYQPFWTDIKAVASAYLNNSRYAGVRLRAEDFILRSEGLFHGRVEIEMPDIIVELTMERKFKSKGRKGVWQVVDVVEKPWPKKHSKSAK